MSEGYIIGGGGTTGATLTVTGVAGDTVTITKDSKTYTRTFNSDGVAVFKGLATGTWTVTMTNGTQTATMTVVVTADYQTSISYFTATINVTYPAGSTCTATDGTTTLTAPDTSGTWACVVPNAGTWTVTATNGDKTKSQAVSITTKGQTASVKIFWVLFDNGDLSTPITGGWRISYRDNSYGNPTINTALSTTNTRDYACSLFSTASSIDLRGYKRILATFNVTNIGGSSTWDISQEIFAGIGLRTSAISAGKLSSSMFSKGNIFTSGSSLITSSRTNPFTLSIDLSGLQNNYYVVVGFGWAIGTCTKVWLE